MAEETVGDHCPALSSLFQLGELQFLKDLKLDILSYFKVGENYSAEHTNGEKGESDKPELSTFHFLIHITLSHAFSSLTIPHMLFQRKTIPSLGAKGFKLAQQGERPLCPHQFISAALQQPSTAHLAHTAQSHTRVSAGTATAGNLPVQGKLTQESAVQLHVTITGSSAVNPIPWVKPTVPPCAASMDTQGSLEASLPAEQAPLPLLLQHRGALIS